MKFQWQGGSEDSCNLPVPFKQAGKLAGLGRIPVPPPTESLPSQLRRRAMRLTGREIPYPSFLLGLLQILDSITITVRSSHCCATAGPAQCKSQGPPIPIRTSFVFFFWGGTHLLMYFLCKTRRSSKFTEISV